MLLVATAAQAEVRICIEHRAPSEADSTWLLQAVPRASTNDVATLASLSIVAASGMRITANSDWIKRELRGEAVDALIHEMVHVIQQYGRAPSWGEQTPELVAN